MRHLFICAFMALVAGHQVHAQQLPDAEFDQAMDQIFDNLVEVPQPRQTEAGSSQTCENCLATQALKKPAADVLEIVRIARSVEKKKSSSPKFIIPAEGEFTSGFGSRRHPLTGRMRQHNGLDIARNQGATVKAAASGKIIESVSDCQTGDLGCNGGEGNLIRIEHADGLVSVYMHLATNCRVPREGQSVRQGQKIGCVGNTGASDGYHLHFAVEKNGKFVNPRPYLLRK